MDWFVAIALGAIVILAIVLTLLGKRDRSTAPYAPSGFPDSVTILKGHQDQDDKKTAERGPGATDR